jgi:hypothetical protein
VGWARWRGQLGAGWGVTYLVARVDLGVRLVVSGSRYYRVVLPADLTPAGGLALARRLLADSGRGPVELGARWRTTRFDVVHALADRLGGADLTIVYDLPDPGPLLVALAAGPATQVVARQPRRLYGSDHANEPPPEAAGYTLRWGGRLGPMLEVSPPLVRPDQLDIEGLTEQVAQIERAGLLSAATRQQALARVLRRANQPWRLPLPDGYATGLDRCAVLWHPGRPVEVVADFSDVHAALTTVTFGPRIATVTLGGYNRPAFDEPLLDTLIDNFADSVSDDAIRIDWDCDLADLSGAYNGFRLEIHEDYEVDFEFHRGGIHLEVKLDERRGRHEEILDRMAERSHVSIAERP